MQKHIYRKNNSTCEFNKLTPVFLCVCPLIDLKIKWRRNVVKVLWIHELQVLTGASLFFAMTKAWKSQFAGKNEKDNKIYNFFKTTHNVIVNKFSRLVIGYWRQVTQCDRLNIWQAESCHCPA